MKNNYYNKLILFSLLISMFSMLLCGCQDKHELREISVAMGIGIDKISGNEPIRITVEIANPTAASVGIESPGKASSYTTEVSTGKSISDAIQNFTKINSLIIDFSHTSIIILSKKLCGYGVSEVLDYLNRSRQFRSTDWLLVADKTAKEILESRMPNEDSTSTGIHNMMDQFRKDPSILPVNINDFVIESESESKSSFAPEITLEKSKDNSSEKIKIEKTAIFKNNHLIGILTNEESKSLLWLSDNPKGHMTILPFDSGEHNENVTVEVNKKSSKIIPYMTKDGVHFEIQCTGNAIIREAQNVDMNTEMVEKIQRNTQNKLKSQLSELIDKAQKDLNADFIGFSKKIYNNNPKEWLHMKQAWDEIFPNIKYKINLKINITNVGIINNSAITNDTEERTK